MDDGDILLRLAKVLSNYFTEGKAMGEDLTYSLTREFLRNIQDVLYTKQLVVLHRWECFFDIHSETMLCCTEVYLRYVIYACLQNVRKNLKAFECLLGVLALILVSSIEMRNRTGLNFCNLVPDVFMVLYDNVLRKSFLKCGGFHEFVKYINDPKYLKKKCIWRNISDFYEPCASVSGTVKHWRKKVSAKEKEDEDVKIDLDFMGAEKDKLSSTYTNRVMEIIKANFFSKSNDPGLNPSKPYLYPQKTEQIGGRPDFSEAVDKGKDSECCPSLSRDSKTNDSSVADNSRYEAIIKSVIRHNNSNNSSLVKSKSPILMEVSQNLEQMKNILNFLIQALDEHDKE